MSILHGGRCRSFLSAWFLCALAVFVLAARPAAAVGVWQRWDQQLQVGFDYLNGGGNPYRDLALLIQFTGPNAAKNFTSYGFWDGGNVFRVRAAFPLVGTWNWRVTSCSGLNGKSQQGQIQPCSSDTTLMSQAGQVVVAANSSSNLLYSNGFLITSGRFLTFTDNPTRRFYWQGDTAWPALAVEGQKRLAQSNRTPGQVTDTWKNYIDDRSSRGFTVLQVGAAIAWQPTIRNDPFKSGCPASSKSLEWGDLSAALPAPETFAFQQFPPPAGQSCVGAVPNNCSRWLTDYWQEVDSMVEYANEKGIVVVMTGVADPTDRGGCRASQTYPRTGDSVIFARNLAARLAGNHVIFSVNFDDWPGALLDATSPSAGTVDSTTRRSDRR